MTFGSGLLRQKYKILPKHSIRKTNILTMKVHDRTREGLSDCVNFLKF